MTRLPARRRPRECGAKVGATGPCQQRTLMTYYRAFFSQCQKNLLLRVHDDVDDLCYPFAEFDFDRERSRILDVVLQFNRVLLELVPELAGHGLGNLTFAYGRVEFADFRSLAGDRHALAGQSLGGIGAEITLTLFLLGALADLIRVAFADGRGRNEGLPVGEEIVQRITVPNNQKIVLLPDAGHILEEENFHI